MEGKNPKCPKCGHPMMTELRDYAAWCANCHYSRPYERSKPTKITDAHRIADGGKGDPTP